MQRFPVTNRQFIAFLDDLVAQGREAEALQHVPRERAGLEGELGAMLYGRTARGGFEVQTDADGDTWVPDWPVMHVDWFGARAYLGWLAERTGRPWRLPGEFEWEKAARGVDARRYPWGDYLDPSWCRMRFTVRGREHGDLGPGTVDAHPVDESPYGVRGLGGNVRDWCLDTEGRIEDRVVTLPEADVLERRAHRSLRGGAWISYPRVVRSAHRQSFDPGHRDPFVGIRGLHRAAP